MRNLRIDHGLQLNPRQKLHNVSFMIKSPAGYATAGLFHDTGQVLQALQGFTLHRQGHAPCTAPSPCKLYPVKGDRKL